jgi:hypothetical protein
MADASDAAGYKPEAAAEYIREKLRDYPNEWELWHRLAHHLMHSANLGAPEFDEAKYDEVVRIHERIAEKAPELDERLRGIMSLAAVHAAAGSLELSEEAAKRLPGRLMSRENAMTAALYMRGERLKKHLEEELRAAVSNIDTIAGIAASGVHIYNLPADLSHAGSREERLALYDFAAKVYELTCNFPWSGNWAVRAAHMRYLAAEMLIDEYGDVDSAFGYLNRAAGYCEPIPGEKPVCLSRGREPFADGAEDYTPTDAARESLLGILNYANDIPKGATSAFIPVRDDPRFLAIIEKLTRRAYGAP